MDELSATTAQCIPIRVVLLVGSDMLKCGIHWSFPRRGLGLAVVMRSGFSLEHFGIKYVPDASQQVKDGVFYLPTITDCEISSSLIYKRFIAKEDLSDLVPEAALGLLLEAWGRR